jgi:hypothetical protein
MSVLEASPLVLRHDGYGVDGDVMALSVDKKTNFAWKEVGFTACSESCLGGEAQGVCPAKFK